MYKYMYIHIFKNVPQEGDSGLDPRILLDWVPEIVFSSPSKQLHIEPFSVLCEIT